MTISSPSIIKTMLERNGVFPGDPAMELIFGYKSPEGKQLFAVFETKNPGDIYDSPYVIEPVLLMEHGKLTEEGKTALKRLQAPAKPVASPEIG